MYCKVTGPTEAIEYTVNQLRVDNPAVSFPKNPSDALLATYDVYPVITSDPPQIDESITNLNGYTIEGSGSTWTQTWQTSAKTPTEQAAHEEQIRNNNLKAAQNDESLYQSVALLVQTVLDPNTLTDIDVAKVAKYYKEWANGVAYAVDDVANYETVLYRCVQAHTSQSDWTPPQVPALWTAYIDPTGPATAWVQPQGAHDAYARGMRVTHNSQTWVNDIDANVWEPGVYGWTVQL